LGDYPDPPPDGNTQCATGGLEYELSNCFWYHPIVKVRGLKPIQFYFYKATKPKPSASTRCLPEI
jgi:hypothetical protein